MPNYFNKTKPTESKNIIIIKPIYDDENKPCIRRLKEWEDDSSCYWISNKNWWDLQNKSIINPDSLISDEYYFEPNELPEFQLKKEQKQIEKPTQRSNNNLSENIRISESINSSTYLANTSAFFTFFSSKEKNTCFFSPEIYQVFLPIAMGTSIIELGILAWHLYKSPSTDYTLWRKFFVSLINTIATSTATFAGLIKSSVSAPIMIATPYIFIGMMGLKALHHLLELSINLYQYRHTPENHPNREKYLKNFKTNLAGFGVCLIGLTALILMISTPVPHLVIGIIAASAFAAAMIYGMHEFIKSELDNSVDNPRVSSRSTTPQP